MGRILSFTPRTAATNRPPPTVTTPAAVIIFPGVRYEPQSGSGPSDPARPPLNKPAPRH
ncbi:MAG: hypothetical protein ACTHNH_11725 [Mesorhizobium sp.]